MEDYLEVGKMLVLPVKARTKYSEQFLPVAPGQRYTIWCEEEQYWRDWFIKTTPEGYNNVLANMIGQRVKSVNCFCLCGVYDKEETTGFSIGQSGSITVPSPIKNIKYNALYFFANDSKGFYWNNRGQIDVSIIRIA